MEEQEERQFKLVLAGVFAAAFIIRGSVFPTEDALAESAFKHADAFMARARLL